MSDLEISGNDQPAQLIGSLGRHSLCSIVENVGRYFTKK